MKTKYSVYAVLITTEVIERRQSQWSKTSLRFRVHKQSIKFDTHCVHYIRSWEIYLFILFLSPSRPSLVPCASLSEACGHGSRFDFSFVIEKKIVSTNSRTLWSWLCRSFLVGGVMFVSVQPVRGRLMCGWLGSVRCSSVTRKIFVAFEVGCGALSGSK